jgi:probable F420-dependent oxidoreductase
MQIGFNMPTGGHLATADALAQLATEGEALGYDFATFSDHIIIPTDIAARYPYSETGEFPAGARAGRHDQLTEMAFVAAKTTRLRLVGSVMVVPHRPAVLTAKMLATIDVLSKGRLTVGIGAGWLREEFEALGTPPFDQRGAVTDEYLQAFRELWTNPNPRFEGKYTKFANVAFEPKPVQKPHPPIWIGGESGPALRRVARLGDGWYPIGTNPQNRLDTLPRLKGGIERLHKLVRDAGREPSSITLAYRLQNHGEAIPAKSDDGNRRLFAGSPADLAGDIRALRDLGISACDFSFTGRDTVEASIDAMRRFRDDVMARV